MKRFGKIWIAVLGIAILLGMTGCPGTIDGGGAGEDAYRAVEDVAAVSTSERAVLSWAKPTEDWFGVRIEISPKVDGWDSAKVYKDETSVLVQNLASETEYAFTLITVDEEGKDTEKKATIEVTTPKALDPVIQEVEKIVEKVVEKEVPVEVIKEVVKEVEKIVEKEVPIEVEKEVPVEVIKEVEKVVEKVVEKKVPVEVVKEVIKEVIKEVDKPADTTPAGKVTELVATAGDAMATLTWKNPTDEDLYGVEITVSAGETSKSFVLKKPAEAYAVYGLKNGTEYTFSVKSIDNALNLSEAEEKKATPVDSSDKTPPADVTNLKAASDDTTVTLTWTDAADADIFGYEIKCSEETSSRAIVAMDKGSIFLAQGAGTYKVTGLSDGKTYKFTVKAMDTNGNKSAGASATATVTAKKPDTTPAGKVTDLAVTVGDSMAALSWKNPTDADFYGVEITLSAGTTSKAVVLKKTETVYVFYGLANGTEYTFSVRTIDNAQNYSDAETKKATPADSSDKTAPADVANLKATGDDTTVTLTWTDATDADIFGYEIKCSEDTASRAIAAMEAGSVFVAQGNGTYKAAGLSDGKMYKFTVKSMDTSGNKSTGATATATVTKNHSHTFKEAWAYNDTHHWHDSTCGHEGNVSDYGEHEFGDWKTDADGITRRACECGYELIASLKGYNAEYSANPFQIAVKKTGATVGSSSNVEKVVFALLSDSEMKTVIEKDAVSATKQDVGTFDDAYYAYYDSESKTLYIVPANEVITKFRLNENSSRLFYDFEKCKEIAGLDLVDTSGVTDMSYMFYYCSGLTLLDLSKFDTSNVTNMRYMFYYCSGLTLLDLSKFNTSNVTNMGSMFYYCKTLTSLDVSGFDTSKVTTMYEMFWNCNALETLKLSNKFDTSNVTNMSNMFYYCNKLISLDVSKFNTSNVTTMAHMFDMCSSLKELDLSSFDTSKVTTMYEMFYNCTALETLKLSNKFDTSNVTDMSYMFYRCENLTSLNVSGFNTSNVTNMGSMFYYCKTLTSLDVRGFNTSKVTDMSHMFIWCKGLTSLDVRGFDTSKVTNMSYMFCGCQTLDKLDVSSFDTSKVTNMEAMFCNSIGLTSLDLSSFNTSNVTNMYYMFKGCSGLTSLDVRGFDTSKVTNMSIMFKDCSGLELLDLSSFDTSKVTNMSNMFESCSGLTTIYVADKGTFIPSGCNTSSMFSNCKVSSKDGLTNKTN